jgi:hypothetical protein
MYLTESSSWYRNHLRRRGAVVGEGEERVRARQQTMGGRGVRGGAVANAPDVRDRESLRVVLAQLREVRVHALKDDVQVRETEQVRRLANVQQLDNVGVREMLHDFDFSKYAARISD